MLLFEAVSRDNTTQRCTKASEEVNSKNVSLRDERHAFSFPIATEKRCADICKLVTHGAVEDVSDEDLLAAYNRVMERRRDL